MRKVALAYSSTRTLLKRLGIVSARGACHDVDVRSMRGFWFVGRRSGSRAAGCRNDRCRNLSTDLTNNEPDSQAGCNARNTGIAYQVGLRHS